MSRRRYTRRRVKKASGLNTLAQVIWVLVRAACLPLSLTFNLIRGMDEGYSRSKAAAGPVRRKEPERYGEPGTWMYKEAKRWSTDPRLYED